MTNPAAQQISAIHAMLSQGHRNLRMEKHSLWLWGGAGGVLFAISDQILTPEQIKDVTLRAFAWLGLLALVFGCIGILDWHLTRSVKAARDEVWSFIHRQIMKIWWLLITIGVLLTFAMFFFGGGYMVCSAWIVLVGLGLFIHGLFSDEVLEWAGGAMLIVGILALAFHFPYQTMKWIAASILSIGLPMLTLMINRHGPLLPKFAQLIAWLLLVLLTPLGIIRAVDMQAPDSSIPVVSLANFNTQSAKPHKQIVNLPKGTLVPVEIALAGDVFNHDQKYVLPFKLSKSVDILMVDGHPTRKVRAEDGEWLSSDSPWWISIPKIYAEILPSKGPVVTANLIVNLQYP